MKYVNIARNISKEKPTLIFTNINGASKIIEDGFLIFDAQDSNVVKIVLDNKNGSPYNYCVNSISLFQKELNINNCGNMFLDFLMPSYVNAKKVDSGEITQAEYFERIKLKIKKNKAEIFDFISSLNKKICFLCESDMFYEKAIVRRFLFHVFSQSKQICDVANLIEVCFKDDMENIIENNIEQYYGSLFLKNTFYLNLKTKSRKKIISKYILSLLKAEQKYVMDRQLSYMKERKYG